MDSKFSLRDYLSIGDIVSIKLSKKKNVEILAKSEIFYLMEPQSILLSEPLLNGVVFEPVLKKPYTMSVYKAEVGRHVFEGLFVKEKHVRDNRFFVVKVGTDIKLEQRRQYFRLPIFIDIPVNIFEKSGDNLIERGQGLLVNISAGGIAFISGDKFRIGDIYNFSFEIEGSTFMLKGKVLRERQSENYVTKSIISVMFVDIDNVKIRKLTGVINVMQIRQLKKD